MSEALFCVKVDRETSLLVQYLLFAKGFVWWNAENVQDIINESLEYEYLFPWNDKTICRGKDNSIGAIELSVKEFCNWVVTDEIPEDKLPNNDYTAVIYKDKLVVGCQTLDKKTSLELAKAIIEKMQD